MKNSLTVTQNLSQIRIFLKKKLNNNNNNQELVNTKKKRRNLFNRKIPLKLNLFQTKTLRVELSQVRMAKQG